MAVNPADYVDKLPEIGAALLRPKREQKFRLVSLRGCCIMCLPQEMIPFCIEAVKSLSDQRMAASGLEPNSIQERVNLEH
eukprot:2159539-Alexandrium_andersonii.AAC.1